MRDTTFFTEEKMYCSEGSLAAHMEAEGNGESWAI
jgi:hypothetical protein